MPVPHEVQGVPDGQHGAGQLGGAGLPVRGVAGQPLVDQGRFPLVGFVELAGDHLPNGEVDHLRQVAGAEGPAAEQAKRQLFGRAGKDGGWSLGHEVTPP